MIHIRVVTKQTRNKISNTLQGHIVNDETRRNISNSLKGKPGHKHSEETKRKISKTRTGQKHSDEVKRKMSLNNRARDPEVRKRMSQSHMGHIPWNKGKTGIYSKEAIEKMSLSHLGQPAYWKGKQLTEKAKQKISETKKKNPHPTQFQKNHTPYPLYGEESPSWKGGISFEPYCPKFNNKLKEEIRERDNRTCQLCGIGENGERHSVHHVHYDKANCEPDLITLCRSCNSKVNTNRSQWELYFVDKLEMAGHIIVHT